MRLALVALAFAALATAEVAVAAVAAGDKPAYPPGTRSARTSLHVARSLDPDAVETLSVRTRTGEVASIVVKRRGPKTAPAALPAPVAVASAPVSFEREPDAANLSTPQDNKDNETKPAERGAKGLSQSGWSAVPRPVAVRSDAVWVKGAGPPSKKGRGLISVGRDGVPVVTGVRVPDDEADRTRTWRNARVINNVLVQGDADAATAAQTERGPVSYEDDPETRDRLLQYIRAVNSLEWSASLPVEARSQDSSEGRGARHLSYSGASESPSGETQARLLVPASAFHHPHHLYSGQRPLLVRPRPAAPAAPLPAASRVSFEEGVRTPVLQYAHPELGVQPAKVARSRLDEEPTLQTEASPVTSSAAPAPAPAPAAGASQIADRRSNLPAHVPPPSALIQKQLAAMGGVDRDDIMRKQEAALAHFARDAHSDRSPFAVEPALDSSDNGDAADAALVAEQQDQTGSQSGNIYERRGRDGPEPSQQQVVASSAWNRRPQPASSYLPDDSYGLSSDKYIRKYPSYGKDSYTRYAGVSSSASDSSGNGGSSYNPYTSGSGSSGYGKYGLSNNRYANQYGNSDSPYGAAGVPSQYNAQYGQYDSPQAAPSSPASVWSAGPTTAVFWTRLGEEIRQRVNSGMARVGDLTRPMVQPLLDATQRLGHNLGLSPPPSAFASAPQRVYVHYDPRHPPAHLLQHFQHHPHHHHHPHQQMQPHNVHGFQEKARSLDADAILLVEQTEEVTPERSSVKERNDEQEQQLRRRRRRRRDALTSYEHSDNALDSPSAEATVAVPGAAAAWAHTPCAKRIFCDAMLQRSHDDVVLTEKKMAAAYALVARGDPSVAFHLGDVMAAVRKGDCSAFACPSGLASKLTAQPGSPRR